MANQIPLKALLGGLVLAQWFCASGRVVSAPTVGIGFRSRRHWIIEDKLWCMSNAFFAIKLVLDVSEMIQMSVLMFLVRSGLARN